MPSKQPLPPKEKTLFNRILKCYEQKQYRNGLKFAKQILSNPKFSEHGETLAMKGLTLNCLNRKEEAYELVKRGLKNDLTSHVCWHVYGLLQRSDKKYDEAIKCYRNALRWDKENLHILRDLSMLQVHMRDLEGYRDTRYTLLQLKSGQRASWIGYAVANHLLKDFDMAFKVLEEFRKTQQSQAADYEYSELLLYQNTILREAGMHKQALDHLEKHESHVTDGNTLLSNRAEILLELERYEEAEDLYTSLLYRNPENHHIYEQLEKAIRPQTEEQRLQIYDAASQIFPKMDSPKIIPLKFVSGQVFRERVDKFLRSGLKRGVPPLFVNLKPLYEDKEKVHIIEEVVTGYLTSLEKSEKFDEADSEKQPPTALLWSWYYIAQHFNQTGNIEKALENVDKALNHTPTLIELHVLKAKILRMAGDLPGAVACMDEAQSLDTADRYVNYKCACYMIRNNMVAQAEEMASKFTRQTVSVQEYLREMQCMWFEMECAHAHFRSKEYGEALKKCHEIDRHFREILEDQFDFHQYCMRKMTLRAYVQMLKLEDDLRSHIFYFEAASIAIKVYIQLHDKPQQMNGDSLEKEENSMSKSELKKMRNKQRKQQWKQAQEERKKQQEQEKASKHRQQRNQKLDEDGESIKRDDLDAHKLMTVEKPLLEAKKFLSSLQQHFSRTIDTHLLAFEIYCREDQYLLMLRSLLRAKKISATGVKHPSLHVCLLRFASKVFSKPSDLTEPVLSVINSQLPGLVINTNLEQYNKEYLEENRKSLPHILAGCRAWYHLRSEENVEAVKYLTDWDKDISGITLQTCLEILDALRTGSFGKLPPELEQNFISVCSSVYPYASVFKLSTHDNQKDDKFNEKNGTLSDEHVEEPKES